MPLGIGLGLTLGMDMGTSGLAIVPSNALTLGGIVLTLGGENLTLG